jgi:hypothetical protein
MFQKGCKIRESSLRRERVSPPEGRRNRSLLAGTKKEIFVSEQEIM